MPRPLLLAVVALATLAACAPVVVDGANIDGSRWHAVSVAGRPPVPGNEPTIRFESGRLNGNAGCNGFASDQPVSVGSGHFDLPPTLLTTGACIDPNGGPSPVMDVENAFWSALTAADRIAFRREQLVISGPAGELVFERAR